MQKFTVGRACCFVLALHTLMVGASAGAQAIGTEASVAPLDATPEHSRCMAAVQRVSDSSAGAALARTDFVASLQPCMTSMHEGMHAALSRASNSTDSTFAEAMIAHHQGAIDMARQLLVYGRDSALRAFALGIIAEQQVEVTQLEHWAAARTSSSEVGRRVTTERTIRTSLSEAQRADTHRDRVYTADQVSNTVSVIDPSTNRLLGQLRLGSERLSPLPSPDFMLGALYGGEINVHGLGFSPDHRWLDVVSTATNAVTIVETATNRVKGTVYVGRNPHEGFFSPDGRELWVSVRGANYVSVIDPIRMRETRRVVTAPGPSMIVFRPDGRVAVCRTTRSHRNLTSSMFRPAEWSRASPWSVPSRRISSSRRMARRSG